MIKKNFNKYWFGPGSYSSCSILAFESEKSGNSIMDTETLYKDVKGV
jgi:hypothetical protein